MRDYFLLTDRIGFSHWCAEDSGLVQLLWGDERVAHFICASGAFTPEEVQRRLQTEMETLANSGVQYYPIFARGDGDLIGCCGLRPTDVPGALEMGCHLRPKYWRMGLAQEALRAVICYSRDELGVRELRVGHHPENSASRRLIARLGCEYIGDKFYPPTGLNHPEYRLLL